MRNREALRRELLEQIEHIGAWEAEDPEILQMIDELVLEHGRKECWSLEEKQEIRQELFYSVRKLDVLQELVEDDEVTEIMVNGWEQIFVERRGRITLWEKTFTSQEKLWDVIQQIAAGCNRVINTSRPIVDARLKNGARVNAVIEPVALNGPILTIRRFPDHPITMEDLIAGNSITREGAECLIQMVRQKHSMLIGGGTGAGKTTFLNALSCYIPSEERIVTIEDNAELQIQGITNLVRLEAKLSNLEDSPQITIRDLIKTALRLRPDRIIIGEVRSSEAVDLLQAVNTGHEGSLSTAHANSAADMVSRLETMVLMGIQLPLEAIRRQIAAGFDILIHLGRMPDKSRAVLEITEITGISHGEVCLHPLFIRRNGERLEKVGEPMGKRKGGI
ncbi:ATPase, T2SS/T4P/T4SS family [Lactonifactor longoviformis]|uniref:CpaF family protein n=1 Tax=Lactonifactor longoviformis TaxID=341220 RepID=UPI00210C3F7E|nr:ATPase, T2SS/T4P/T4SS family [Lactonifactor longoviformis]MCQ4670221.1 ATPase, T2SS/T4P/T4SS family [Lactonifactor longoviformis]